MKKGFSLVELSIVLVILGLLVGGILAGQSLIRASELRAAGTEFQRYVTATQAFRDKYFALPGDMANATNIWSTTGNGNGNGQLDDVAPEIWRVWQHLSLAGLIEGQYTGVKEAASSWGANTDNVPRSKISNGLWWANNWGPQAGNGLVMGGNYNNFFELGRSNPGFDPSAGLLTPEELWNIDTKLDDGKPGRGMLVARNVNTCTLAANGTSANWDTDYKLTNPGAACVAIFRNAF